MHRPDAKEGIPPSRLTLAELFKDAGYATACIGKWHLGFQEQFLPKNQGFDHYFGILHNLDSFEVIHFEDKGGMPLLRNGEVVQRNTDPGALAKLYTDEAISWIENCVGADNPKKNAKPFFLYLPHTMLHVPLGVSPEFRGSSNWGLYGDALEAGLEASGYRILERLILEPGEESKNLANWMAALDRLVALEDGTARSVFVVNLGGGVIGNVDP